MDIVRIYNNRNNLKKHKKYFVIIVSERYFEYNIFKKCGLDLNSEVPRIF